MDLVRAEAAVGAGARLGGGGGGRAGVQRPGLRLADRGRAAEPAERRDRAAAAGHAGVRLPAPGGGGGVPAAAAGRATWPAAGSRSRRGPPWSRATDGADRDRGDGLPVPRRRRAAPRSCGSCSRRAPTRSRGSRPTGAGTWTVLYDPDPEHAGDLVRARRRVPARRGRSSTRGSSGSPRARRWPWTRSSGCCWRCPGRRWSGPASTRRRCAARPTGVFVGAAPSGYGDRPGRPSRARAPDDRDRDQRAVRPGLLHARPGGPGGDGGHGVLVVAGGAAPGLPGAAVRRVLRWRWPAASG